MPFRVETTGSAERDFLICQRYLFNRNPDGATRWVEAFEQALLALEQNPHRGLAPENEDHPEDIRQLTFKTRRGLTYRLLFVIREETVYVIHIRGPGQSLMRAEEVEFPPEDRTSGN